MPKPSKLQLLSAAAASVLLAYVAAAATMQSNQTPHALDIPTLPTADAALVDYFLRVEGIEGESTNGNYPGFIEIDAFSWGLTNSGSAITGNQITARPTLQDFHFAAHTSKASPKLFQACANGQHFQSMLFVGVRTVGEEEQEFLKITLDDALISSYQVAGSQNEGSIPTDSFSINFSSVEYEYKPQNPDGSLGESVKGSYSVKSNK